MLSCTLRWLARSPLAFVLVAAVASPAQQPAPAFVSVADLLSPVTMSDPYLAPLAMRGRRLVLGEEEWLGIEYDYEQQDTGVRRVEAPWFSGSALLSLLGDLLPDVQHERLTLLRGDRELMVFGGLAPVVRAGLEELRQRLPPVVRVEIELLRHTAAGEERLLARTLECASGRRAWTSDVASVASVVDYEVEIAQAAQIANPVQQVLRSGAMVVLRPFVSPGEAIVWLDVLARVVERGNEAPIDTGHAGFGPIDRAHQRLFELGGVLTARLGARTVQRWSGPDGTGYELRLAPTWQAPAPVRPGGHEVEYLPVWSGLTGHRSVAWTQIERDGNEPTPTEAGFADAIAAVPDTRSVESSRAVVAVDAAAEHLRSLVHERHAAAAPVALQIDVFDAATGAAPGGDGAPADGRRLGGAVLQTVVGAWSCATAFEEMTLVTDWDTEVAQSSRIPDPKCVRVACGLFLNVRCAADAVELDGEFSWRGPIESRPTPLDVAVQLAGGVQAHSSGGNVSASTLPAVLLPQDVVRMEAMTVQRLGLAGQMPLRRDAPAVLRRASAQLGSGRELVVTVRRVD